MAKQTGEEIKSAEKYPRGRFSRFRDWLAETRFGQTKGGKNFVYHWLGKKHFEPDAGPFIEDGKDSGISESSEPEGSAARDNLGDKKAAPAASEPPAAQATAEHAAPPAALAEPAAKPAAPEFGTTDSPTQPAPLQADFEATIEAARPAAEGVSSSRHLLSPREAMTPLEQDYNPLEIRTVRMPLYAEEVKALEKKALDNFSDAFSKFSKGKVPSSATYDHLLNGIKLAVVAKMRSQKPELLDTPFSELAILPDFHTAYSDLHARALRQSGILNSSDTLEQVATDIQRRVNGETRIQRATRAVGAKWKSFAKRHPILTLPFQGKVDDKPEFLTTQDQEADAFAELIKANPRFNSIDGETQTYEEINVQHLDIDIGHIEKNAIRSDLNDKPVAVEAVQSTAATEQAATSAASEAPAAPATAAPAAAAEATTAKVESTLAEEKSWLARVGETVKANKGKTAVATLAAAGLSYAAYEALREKAPSSDVAIGK